MLNNDSPIENELSFGTTELKQEKTHYWNEEDSFDSKWRTTQLATTGHNREITYCGKPRNHRDYITSELLHLLLRECYGRGKKRF